MSALSSECESRFMAIKGRVNATVFIEFLKRLVHTAAPPTYLMVDNHPSRKAVRASEYPVGRL